MSGQSQTDQPIRDYVFPLVVAEKELGDTLAFRHLLGTAFLIGNRGFALTAAHVVQGLAELTVVGMFVATDAEWTVFQASNFEIHPTEDIAVFHIQGLNRPSFLQLATQWIGSSARYRTFGYPEDVATELDRGGVVLCRPDLVYTEGYVRRRLRHALPSIRGSLFLELSEVAGPGSSGSPLISAIGNRWSVSGIYVGQKVTTHGADVGFAAVAEVFGDWSPASVGHSLVDESLLT